jgi:hypothetical protein
MAKGFWSNQNSHGVVAHQGINAHQGEVLFNSLSNQQPAGWLCQPPDQHTGVKKEAIAAQGIRNSSARGASKFAWVRILPSKPPGCRGGVAAARVADSSRAASRAPTWLRSSALRHSSWRCSDGLKEVMANRRSANLNSRWVKLSIRRQGRPSRLKASMSSGSKTWGLRLSRSARIAASCSSIERSAWADGSGGAGASSLGRIGWVPYGERSAYVSSETLIEREVMHG